MDSKVDRRLRIAAIDLARGVALVAMAIFHFGWDLENFGLVREAMTLEPQWIYFARAIAASFLMLVGLSAWLAHENKFNKRTFIKRLLYVGGAALVITLATLYATPNAFIFFGILHNIALSSLVILLFMRMATKYVAIAGLIVFSAPYWARTAWLDNAIWWWSGLSQITPKSNDYVPMFPWFGWVLLGLALAKLFSRWEIWGKLSGFQIEGPIGKTLRFFGRYSLLFYLVHQPLMIGLLYAFIKLSAGI